VVHRSLGAGRVSRVERGRRWAWVVFDASPHLPGRVRGSELEPEGQAGDEGAGPPVIAAASPPAWRPKRRAPTPDPSPRQEPGSAAATDPRSRALILLEALRLGAVPRGEVGSYTVGREHELAAVGSCLDPDPGPGGRLRVVVGDYGTGKTHMLECARDAALARNHAVAVATLDSREATPARPRRVYRALIRGLALPDGSGGGGLGPLFDRLRSRGHVPLPSSRQGAHRYLDPALLYHAGLAGEPALQELLLEWIDGEPGERSEQLNKLLRRRVPGPRLLALPDFRTFGSIYAYLLGGVACLCREAGYEGLCVLLDEAEFYAALRAEDRAFAETVFACWALACLQPGQALRSEGDIRKGGQAVHRAVPLRHCADQPLSCVFFLTPDPAGLEALGRWVDLERHQVEIAALQPRHYRELYERIYSIYRRAHPDLALGDEVSGPMGELLHAALACGALPNPRSSLKLVVELLDIVRLAPRHLGAVMDDLVGLFGGA